MIYLRFDISTFQHHDDEASPFYEDDDGLTRLDALWNIAPERLGGETTARLTLDVLGVPASESKFEDEKAAVIEWLESTLAKIRALEDPTAPEMRPPREPA
ncbi:MAG: hypothetical protein GY795_24670 [Desulfobacterales bacterium]|nr:hypothetical protein [Desulfobacterales bacterium]